MPSPSLISESSSIPETVSDSLPSLPQAWYIIPFRNWLPVANETSGSRSWTRVLLIAGASSGVIVLSSYAINNYFKSTKRKKGDTLVPNGSATKTGTRPKTLMSSPVMSKARDEVFYDVVDGPPDGLGLLLSNARAEDDDNANFRSFLSTPRELPTFGNRRRDSITSGTTTLMLTTRDPSELILYGLESLKRAIRLWEETRSQLVLEIDSFGSVSRENSPDSELEFILSKARQLADDVESYRKEMLPAIMDDDKLERLSQRSRHASDDSLATELTLPFFDIEPNIHFFKLYTNALDIVDEIAEPRGDRTIQLKCGSREEFLAKVHCLRAAFSSIFEDPENVQYFASIGKDMIQVLLSHSLQDSSPCFVHLDEMLDYVTNESNYESMREEVAMRRIATINFYDLVIDYIILESFDDSRDPPSGVAAIANNKWLSTGFRELALQTAVSAVLKIKRNKITVQNGFFHHFYNVLDHVSPVLAWGFLGSDLELKMKCDLIKDTLEQLAIDFMSFDRVRYTSLNDLKDDILRITDESYHKLCQQIHVQD